MIRIKGAAAAAAVLGLLTTTAWAQPAQPPAPGRAGQAAQPQPTGEAAVVRVTGGPVQGVVYNDIAVYRGVPFAASPVGELRWRAPQPVRSWSGVKDASQAGGSCAAVEDCLYLNVYKPANARQGARLPVMVWIHGGAFTGGSGSIYDGSNFARHGAVVVTVNYRLGRAGWYTHPAIVRNAPRGEAVGNYGLQDNIAALQWVQKNAAAFGGNPRNVTIFGESAGAINVNYLMISPPARGLFHKAISQSGFGRLEPRPLADNQRVGQEYFATLGVTGDSAQTLAAMRAIPFDRLRGNTPLGSIGPIMDGRTIVTSTALGFAQGRQAKVPYILGGNSNEASLFPTQNPAARLAALTAQRNLMLEAYDPQNRGEAARIVNAIVTDQQITEPDRHLARGHVRAGAPTYAYYFSYIPVAQRATSFGLAHGAEIGYVFGRNTATPEDAAISRAANAYWAQFARTGDPGSAGGPRWPRYDLQREARLEFAVDGIHVREQFHKARLDWLEQNRDLVLASAAAGAAPAAGASPAGTPPAGRGGGRGGAGGRGGGRGGN